MRFYRLKLLHEGGVSAGYSFYASKADANSAAAAWRRNSPGEDKDHQSSIETIEITPTKAGILAALNRYGNHPDNG